MRAIMNATSPIDMEETGGKVIVDEEWDNEKSIIMEELLIKKLQQN